MTLNAGDDCLPTLPKEDVSVAMNFVKCSSTFPLPEHALLLHMIYMAHRHLSLTADFAPSRRR